MDVEEIINRVLKTQDEKIESCIENVILEIIGLLNNEESSLSDVEGSSLFYDSGINEKYKEKVVIEEVFEY